MNSRQLRYFISVAKEKNIGKAANYLPLTQSAIAKNIISLEEELGVVLFERQARGVKLTPAGEIWLRHAHQLLQEVEQADNDVRCVSKSTIRQRFDIGIPSQNLIGLTALDKIIANFSEDNPGVDVVIHKMLLRQQQVEALRQGTILAAFNTTFRKSPDLVIDMFAQESAWVVTGTNHPLANNSAVHLEKLREFNFIGFQESKPFHDSFETAFKIHNIIPKVEYTSSDVFAHLGLCACDKGVSLLSPVLQTLRFPGVKFIPLLSDFSPTIRYECAHLKKTSSPLLDNLIKTIQSYKERVDYTMKSVLQY